MMRKKSCANLCERGFEIYRFDLKMGLTEQLIAQASKSAISGKIAANSFDV